MDLGKLNLGELYEEPTLIEKAAGVLIKAAGVGLALVVLYVLMIIILSLGGG